MAPPRKANDIWSTRVYQVECAVHGIVDEPTTAAGAEQARRDHWNNRHE